MHRFARSSALALLTLGAASCATTIPIQSVQPGRVSLGASTELTLVKGEGRRSARETIAQEIVRQARHGGYFSVQDHSEDPIFVRVSGGRVEIDGEVELVRGIGMRVDVLEWDHDRGTTEIETRQPDGTTVVEEIPMQQGHVLLAVTLFDEAGRAILSESEYNGEFATQDLDAPRERIVDQAAAMAVAHLLGDLTPRRVTTHVTLDDSDPGQEHILATAKAGSIAQAAADCRAYLQQNPDNASAAYNLAVFLDSMGQYDEAMTHYDQAMSMGNNSLYSQARAQCARRQGAARELSASPR